VVVISNGVTGSDFEWRERCLMLIKRNVNASLSE